MVRAARQHFAQVFGMSLRGDRPKNVSQVLRSEPRRYFHVIELRVDLRAASLRLDHGLTLGPRQQDGSPEIDRSRAAAILIVHRFHRAFDYSHTVNGNIWMVHWL